MACINSLAAPAAALNVAAGRTASGPVSRLASFDGLRRSVRLSGARATAPEASRATARLSKHKVLSAATASEAVEKAAAASPGMSIVFVSAEVSPWSKTGGLGDVVGSLPPALAARGHRVMTVSPRYDQYKDAWDTNVRVKITMGDGTVEEVGFFHCYKRGVDRVFIDHPLFLAKVWGKTGMKIYGMKTGEDFVDNQRRFQLFNRAAIEAARVLQLNNSPAFSGPYGDSVVFVANDWHAALLPSYLEAVYKPAGAFTGSKSIFCIHNIAYQGRFAAGDFKLLGLPESYKEMFHFVDGLPKPVLGPKINWAKAAFLTADKSMTVSPNYAREIASGPSMGVELDDVVRSIGGVTGIINGMDTVEWDPSADKYLPVPFDAKTVANKTAIKEALQAEVGLPVDPSVPLLVFIGRLEEQKGSDILYEALPSIMKEDCQIIILGTGKKYLEKHLTKLETQYPDKARGVVKFNVPLAHMMNGGADFIVVPSRFEPCGLIQLHAMRYGTIPIVSSTGGLVDTVAEGVTGFQMGQMSVESGLSIEEEIKSSTEEGAPWEVDPSDVAAMATTVRRALATYGTPAFETMRLACMAADLSWKGPAGQWEEVLLSLNAAGSKPAPHPEGKEISPKAKANVADP